MPRPAPKLTPKQQMIAAWVARGLDPVTAAHRADRIIERQQQQKDASTNTTT